METESHTWDVSLPSTGAVLKRTGRELVAWVTARGGSARYTGAYLPVGDTDPYVTIRTADGSDNIVVRPGDTVVHSGTGFMVVPAGMRLLSMHDPDYYERNGTVYTLADSGDGYRLYRGDVSDPNDMEVEEVALLEWTSGSWQVTVQDTVSAPRSQDVTGAVRVALDAIGA